MQEVFEDPEYSDTEDAQGETKKVKSKIWRVVRKFTWVPVRSIVCVALIIALQIIRGILLVIKKVVTIVF